MRISDQRVLDALWRVRYEERENDGWTFLADLWLDKVDRNHLGLRMCSGTIVLALTRLERADLVESKSITVRPPSHPYPRRRGYRITEHGDRERARHPRRTRRSLLGWLVPRPDNT